MANPLAAVPSHDNSSHSGSEGVERVNPFEQQIITSNSNASAGRNPLEQVPSQQSASPDRTVTTPPPPSSPQPAMTGVGVANRSPSSMPRLPIDPSSNSGHLPHMPYNEEDDSFTHSSSAVNSTEPASSYTPSTGSLQQPGPQPGMAHTFARFIETTRKRITVHTRNTSDDDLIEDLDGMIIQGYLQKLGRNGKWQTRWFESDGECLSYYKNENRTKLLATLDLEKVRGWLCMLLSVTTLGVAVGALRWVPSCDFSPLAR